jgi:hypothetical protein
MSSLLTPLTGRPRSESSFFSFGTVSAFNSSGMGSAIVAWGQTNPPVLRKKEEEEE